MRRLLPLLAAALTLAAALLCADRLSLAPIDDAYITFRAAVNLAHGDGPVFNPGERVESATCPLWVAVLALSERLGAGPVAASGPWVLLFAGLAAALSTFCAFELGGPVAALLAAIALAAMPAWSAWVCVGMEGPLAGLLVSATALLALREHPIAAGLLFAASACTRPEAVVILPALLLALPRQQWNRFLTTAITPLVALVLARHAYFGEWVPNTYVAKRGGLGSAGLVRGIVYVVGFALANLVLTAAVFRSVFRKGAPRPLALICILFAGAVAWDGGDHFALDRLFVPLLPIASALLGTELARLPRWSLPLALSLMVVVPLGLPDSMRMHSPIRAPHALGEMMKFSTKLHGVNEALADLPPGRVATVSIGIIGFESRRRILDLVGLADPHIARSPHLVGVVPGHDHSDVDYVLAERPEYALFAPELSPVPVTQAMEEAWLVASDSYFRAARLLENDPRFRAAYEALDARAPDGRHLRIWRLRP